MSGGGGVMPADSPIAPAPRRAPPPPYTESMTTRGFDPSRLDVAAFAKEGATLDGRWPLAEFDRLVADRSSAAPPLGPDDVVAWQLRGERRALRGGGAETRLRMTAAARVLLECQRCLQPVEVDLACERGFVFVPGEDQAAALDAESDDDVLALTRALDVRELVEDELLLALPLVPKHAVCVEPLPVPADDAPEAAAENVFAGLAQLKRGGSLN